MGKGFFGIFSKKSSGNDEPVKVSTIIEETNILQEESNDVLPEEVTSLRDILQEILDEMGFISVVKIVKVKGEDIVFDIKSEDTGRIIGKEGATLNALQFLMRNILNKKTDKKYNLVLDASQYREKRVKSLETKAKRAARTAMLENKEVALGPMSASDRRIVHMTLEDNKRIQTYSQGEKDRRQVIVAPKRQRSTSLNDKGLSKY